MNLLSLQRGTFVLFFVQIKRIAVAISWVLTKIRMLCVWCTRTIFLLKNGIALPEEHCKKFYLQKKHQEALFMTSYQETSGYLALVTDFRKIDVIRSDCHGRFFIFL